ncbi:MAG: hypothetical protein KBC06_02405, partial [Candidatus Pacebacteria bacterium]|nr:hypothetical protein [Candidatus Paceibacterota bacterium]
MRYRLLNWLFALFLVVAAPLKAQGSPCSLPQATFGGTGIPYSQVMCSTFGGVTIGLTATGRYSNPPTTTDGLGTYYATVGGDPSN